MRQKNPLNPEAGYVRMPDDPAEVEAAVHAGRVTLRLFPYYRWRYGERGAAFTRSDSAWLAWLAGHEQGHVTEQVVWLWAVLSNRGMPGRLLEIHLRGVTRQLTRAVPQKAADFQRLTTAGEELGARRVAAMPDPVAEDVAARLSVAAGLPDHRLVRGAGRLLADAVADEANGAPHAIISLTSWLADVTALRATAGLRDALPERLRTALDDPDADHRWAAAVSDVVELARGSVRVGS